MRIFVYVIVYQVDYGLNGYHMRKRNEAHGDNKDVGEKSVPGRPGNAALAQLGEMGLRAVDSGGAVIVFANQRLLT